MEAKGPRASCARKSNTCEGYDWGYNYAKADMAFVKASGFKPKMWWLDIETGENWPTTPADQKRQCGHNPGGARCHKGCRACRRHLQHVVPMGRDNRCLCAAEQARALGAGGGQSHGGRLQRGVILPAGAATGRPLPSGVVNVGVRRWITVARAVRVRWRADALWRRPGLCLRATRVRPRVAAGVCAWR